jgi:hypothetical protein
MSLAVDVEIESMDMAVRRCTQALIDCGAMGCFIDIEWEKLKNIPTRPLTKPIPVYNVNSTTNDTGDNLNTTQTPECSKGKYNAKIIKRKSLLRSHQQPT